MSPGSAPSPPPAAATGAPKPVANRDQACLDRMTAAGFEFEIITLAPASKPACVIDTPVRLKAIKSGSKVNIRLIDEPVLSCRFADPLGHWLGELVGPVVAGRLGNDVRAVRSGPGYECRNRNNAEAGVLSAHAIGLALDIFSFDLTNGSTLTVKPDNDTRARTAIDAVRKAACGWFTTVLGPGTDQAHAEHLHVDILQHGSSDRYRICQ